MDRNATRKTFLPKFLLFLIVFLVGMFVFVFYREISNKKNVEKEITEMNAEIEQLKLRKENFLALVDNYQSNFFVEEEARTKFNLQKPGEQVAVIKLNETNTLDNWTTAAAEDRAAAVKYDGKNNFVLWWEYFFNK